MVTEKKRAGCLALTALTATLAVQFVESPAKAGWFGPTNFEECVLEGMKGVSSDFAAKMIARVCRDKFPPEPRCDFRAFTPAEEEAVSASALVYAGPKPELRGTVHNANQSMMVIGADVTVTDSDDITLVYPNVSLVVFPATTEKFSVKLSPGKFKPGAWSFRLSNLSGC